MGIIDSNPDSWNYGSVSFPGSHFGQFFNQSMFVCSLLHILGFGDQILNLCSRRFLQNAQIQILRDWKGVPPTTSPSLVQYPDEHWLLATWVPIKGWLHVSTATFIMFLIALYVYVSPTPHEHFGGQTRSSLWDYTCCKTDIRKWRTPLTEQWHINC